MRPSVMATLPNPQLAREQVRYLFKALCDFAVGGYPLNTQKIHLSIDLSI